MTGRKATRRYHSKLKRLLAASAAQRQAAEEGEGSEFRRWTPEEVVEKKLLPYRSARVLKQRCYERKVWHHNDGGRITFSAETLRKEQERTVVEPFAKPA